MLKVEMKILENITLIKINRKFFTEIRISMKS